MTGMSIDQVIIVGSQDQKRPDLSASSEDLWVSTACFRYVRAPKEVSIILIQYIKSQGISKLESLLKAFFQ